MKHKNLMHSAVRTLAARASVVVGPCALAQGNLVAWGDDSTGLVSGVPGGTYVAVAAGQPSWAPSGSGFVVAIRADGTLVSWDAGGPLSTPAGTFTAVAAGGRHSVGIRTDGRLVAWGHDSDGQVSGPNADGGTFIAVAAGDSHTVAVRSDGTLASWGYDGFYQVSGTPAGTFTDVAAAFNHSMAIRTDGTIANWGGGIHTTFLVHAPAGTFSALAANAEYSVGIRPDGSLLTWHETGVESSTPGSYVAIATSGYSVDFGFNTFAIRADGTIAAWGDDAFGQVSGVPGGSYTAIAAAGGFCVAIAAPPPVIVSALYDQSKAHRRTSTVPIKIQVLDGATGANLSSASLQVQAVSVTHISGTAPGPLENSCAANPDYNFRFDPDLGQGGGYIFNLSLAGYATGTYQLNFMIGSDPTLHSVEFQVK
jgi:hypothetical protein